MRTDVSAQVSEEEEADNAANKNPLRSPEGVHIAQRPKTHFEDTWGLRPKLPRTVCEDTCKSADTCHPKTAKTRGRLKTLPGKHTYRSEDTWPSEKTT